MPDLTFTELVALIGGLALFIPLITAALQYRQSVKQEYEKSFRAIVEKLSAGKKEERVAAASSLGTFIKKSDFTRKRGKFYDESIDVLVNTIAIELDHNVLNAIRSSLEKIEKEDYRDVIQKLLAIDTNSFVYEYPVKKRKVLAEFDIETNGKKFSMMEALLEGALFSWDKIPGNDNLKLVEFLRQIFSIDWIKNAKIEKIDSKVIEVSTEVHFLSLRLNDKETRVDLMIDDGRVDNFTVKAENGELNIYKKNEKIDKMIHNNLEKEIILNQDMSSKFKRDLDELKVNDELVVNFISSFLNAKEFPMTNLKFYRNSMNEIVLSDLELAQSKIINSSFSSSIMDSVIFNDRTTITNSVFTNSRITKSKIINLKIESSLFDQVIFKDVDFSGSEFKDVYFTGADLTGVSFNDTKGLKGIYFYKAKNTDKARFNDVFKKELNETLANVTEDEFKKHINNEAGLTEQRKKDLFLTLEELKLKEEIQLQ